MIIVNLLYKMKNSNHIKSKKLFIALLLVSATHLAMASFTSSADKKLRNIYSLKNFNKNFYKSTSPFSLRSGYNYKGLQLLSQTKQINGDISVNSMMRFEKGYTTYIYPYTHKVILPKFKTPAPPSLR